MGDDDITQGQYPNVLRAILAMPWAIDHDSVAWAAIVDVLALRSVGQGLTDEEIAARIEAAQNGPRRGGGQAGREIGIYSVPVYGVISPRQNMMARSSGGTTAESIGREFQAALASPDVDGIIFDIDSPGGAVEGIAELAAEIRAARGTKPIVAVAHHMASSAAYWLAASADEIVASPSAIVGSIGVFTAHDDVSEAQAKLGVKRTVISAGKHKAEGALGQPLPEEAREHVQAQVNEIYAMMTSDIAKGRSYGGRTVGVDVVRGETYGEGRVLLAKAALAAGMVDAVDTFDNTVRRMARSIATSRSGNRSSLAASVAGLSFMDRIEAVAAEADAIAAEAHKRGELRAEEGRVLSEATREGLRTLADSLRDVAAETDEASPDDEPGPPPPVAARRRADFELLEATARHRAYRIPQAIN